MLTPYPDRYIIAQMPTETMETIFDHAITPREMDVLLAVPLSKAKWDKLNNDADTNFGYIFRLYSHRGDDAKAAEYLAKIVDPEYRSNLAVIDTV
jgi:hypothetical protein